MIQRVESVQQFLAKEKEAFKNLEENTKIKQQSQQEKLESKKGENIAKGKVLSSGWFMFEMALVMQDKEASKIQEGYGSQAEAAGTSLGALSQQQQNIGGIAQTMSEDSGLSSQQMSQDLMREQEEGSLNSSQAFLEEQKVQSLGTNIQNSGSLQAAIGGMATEMNTLALQQANFLRNARG